MAALTTEAVNFDPLARPYRALERLAFGRSLERARFRFLDQLSTCEHILVLGEGDGRCLERLSRIAPFARIHCVDASRAMLARAEARLPDAARTRVVFEQADVLRKSFAPASYDAVVTLFFLDCFTADQVAAIVARVTPALSAGSPWLFTDFAVPAGRLASWRARIWLDVMYRFFRWQTGLAARSLPPSEPLLRAQGFQCREEQDFKGGFVRSAVYRIPVSATTP
jgi:SAM-dependent methyltransferase